MFVPILSTVTNILRMSIYWFVQCYHLHECISADLPEKSIPLSYILPVFGTAVVAIGSKYAFRYGKNTRRKKM